MLFRSFGSYTLSFSGVNESSWLSFVREETGPGGDGVDELDIISFYVGIVFSFDQNVNNLKRGKQGSVNQGKERRKLIQEIKGKNPEDFSGTEIEIDPNKFNPSNNSNDPSLKTSPNLRRRIIMSLASIKGFPNRGPYFERRRKEIPRKNKGETRAEYFDRVLRIIEGVEGNNSKPFPKGVYGKVVQKITDLKKKCCGRSFSVYLEIEITVKSNPIEDELSDDAGVYRPSIGINLTKNK